MRSLLRESEGADVWGIGIGLPGPVEWETGRPVAPPIMPGWDGFDVRGFFSERYHRAVWVDNDVNAMATGEVLAGVARGNDNAIYIKVGTGIGAGLISQGRLHRGTQGAAGDIGHMGVVDSGREVVCRCGNSGCLEALAGGAALARDAAERAEDLQEGYLAQLRRDGREFTSASVIEAARHADPIAIGLLTTSAKLVGEALAGMVNIFNPSIVVVGGSVGRSSDLYLATMRRVVLGRSLPLATRSLQIMTSPLGDQAGPIGLAYTVLEELFSPEILATWIDSGSPASVRV
jgi:predicted NBD/HSP70 family sugar kinase